MAGGLPKQELFGFDLTEYANEIQKVTSSVNLLLESLTNLKKTPEGIRELNKVTKEQIDNAKKLVQYEQQLNKLRIQAANAIKAETNAKKSTQLLTNAEIRGRIQNAQAIAAEERAKQAKIRTDKLETQGIQKKTSAFKGLITSLRNYLVLYVSISQLTGLVKNIFNTTKNLDSLDFSMKKVITDQREFAQTQEFLSNITTAYGAELISTTERYIKFRAAAQQSNLTAKDTQQIFESMTKIAGTLGLKTDELTGVYLALEQMLSKGKVTTEELRRQLGERIPGAFGIMAKAVQVLNPNIEVTISTLDKMLKSGSVISAEVLPEFARQAEKAFGVENVTKVNTLAAAQARYTIALQETVKAIESSNFFIGVLEKITNSFKGLKDLINGVNEEFIRGKSQSEIYANNLISIAERAGDQARYKAIKEGLNSENIALKQNQAIVESLTNSIEKQKESATSLADQLKNKDTEAYAVLSNAINNYRGQLLKQLDLVKDYFGQSTLGNIDQRKQNSLAIKDLIFQSNSIEILKSKVKELTELKKEDKKEEEETEGQYKKRLKLAQESAEKELALFKQSQQIELAEQAKHSSEIIDNDDVLNAALEEQKYESDQRIIDEEIRLQEELLKIAKVGSTERADIESKIEKLKFGKTELLTKRTIQLIDNETKAAKKLLKEQKENAIKTSEDILSNSITKGNEAQEASLKKANEEIRNSKGKQAEIERISDALSLKLINDEKNALAEALLNDQLIGDQREQALKRMSELDAQYAEKELDIEFKKEQKKRDLRQQTFDKSVELLNAGFDFANTIFDNQLKTAETTFNAETAAAGESLDAQITAKRKYEKEVNEIRRKQAIAEKVQAAMNIALSTAQAIIGIWAQVPKFDFGISAGVLTGIVAALGAAQLATVLATPIPAFAKGTENAPSTFLAGEEGMEAIQTKSGKTILTPNKATLFSDNEFIGARVIPADRTAEMLSNMAINQFGTIVDMTESNKHLSKIAKNTGGSNPQPFYDKKGRMHIKQGSTTYIH